MGAIITNKFSTTLNSTLKHLVIGTNIVVHRSSQAWMIPPNPADSNDTSFAYDDMARSV